MADLSFNVFLKNEIPNYIFFVDTSGSIGIANFEKVKLALKRIIEELPGNVNIEIIAFSTTPRLISILKSNKKSLLDDIENKLKYDDGGTYLNEALKMGEKTITNFCSNQKNYFVLLTDGVPSDDPRSMINRLILKSVDFIILAIGMESKKEALNSLFPGQKLFMLETFSSLNKCVSTLIPSYLSNPFSIKIYPEKKKIQKSSEDFCVCFELSSIFPKDEFLENEITIIVNENKYYSGYEVKVGQITSEVSPSKTTVRLKVKCPHEILPSHIEFEIKVKGVLFHGHFDLMFAWFAGDVITRNPINIWVDGMAGHGKSSILNLLLNCLSLNFNIEEFLLVAIGRDHVTTEIRFQSVAHLLINKIINQSGISSELIDFYKNIIKSLKIVFVDKPGMDKNKGSISYTHAINGQYSNKQNLKDLIAAGEPKSLQECHAVLFVISIGLLDDEVDLELMKGKIKELVEAKIKPIIVVTFCDTYSPEDVEIMKKKMEEKLRVEKNNIFYLTPYINGQKQRDSTKDRDGWLVLKSIVDVANRTGTQKFLDSLPDDINNNILDEFINGINIDANTSTATTTTTASTIVTSATTTTTFPTSTTPNSNGVLSNGNDSPAANCVSPILGSGSPIPVSASNIWTIRVKNEIANAKVNEAKFKIDSSTTFKEFVSKVSLKFKLCGQFSFIDEEKCDLAFPDDSILHNVLSNNITLSISE
ncbi:hypothetical protein ACTA71_005802 [Dictyostelium dimigraforme]